MYVQEILTLKLHLEDIKIFIFIQWILSSMGKEKKPHPIGNRREFLMYKLSPANKTQEKKFKEYNNEIENFIENLRKDLESKINSFDIFDVELEDNDLIPYKERKRAYHTVLFDITTSYSNFLYKNENILEQYKQRKDSDELVQDIPIKKVDINNNKLLLYTKYHESPLKFNIKEFYIPNDNKTDDSPVFSYKNVENMSNEKRVELFNNMDSLRLLHTEKRLKESLNKRTNTKSYADWSLDAFQRRYSEVRKEEEAKNFVKNAFNNSNNDEEFILNLVGMLTDFEALKIYCLLSENMEEDTILNPYGIIGSELSDFLIQKYNLNYVNIPQIGRILLSKKDFPFNNNKFVQKYHNKKRLNKKDKTQIYKALGYDKFTIKKFLEHSQEYKFREITKLTQMKKEYKITQKEINSYAYSLYTSDLTEEGIFKIVKDGRHNRKHMPDQLNINKLSSFSKKFTPNKLIDQTKII